MQTAQKRTEHLRERARSQAEGRKKMGKQMTTHSVNWVRVASLQPKICRNITNINVSQSLPISRLLTRLAVEAMGPKVFQMEQFHMVSTENTARIHHRCQYTLTGTGAVTTSISTQYAILTILILQFYFLAIDPYCIQGMYKVTFNHRSSLCMCVKFKIVLT